MHQIDDYKSGTTIPELLAPFDLFWIEDPFSHEDAELHARYRAGIWARLACLDVRHSALAGGAVVGLIDAGQIVAGWGARDEEGGGARQRARHDVLAAAQRVGRGFLRGKRAFERDVV